MIILILGPQGSGKTTQAKLLAEKRNYEFLSMGGLLRSLYEEGDPLGIKAAEWWKEGRLVPTKLLKEILHQYFSTHEDSEGFVIDGFPRNDDQYEWKDEVLPESIDVLFLLQLDEKTIMERLEKRRGKEHRADETPEAIAERLRIYREKTKPIIDRFREDGIPVIEVDARPSIEEIQETLLSHLKELFSNK